MRIKALQPTPLRGAADAERYAADNRLTRFS
jgi:hypothetical protein